MTTRLLKSLACTILPALLLAPPTASSQDYMADPNFSKVGNLADGFMPDPQTVSVTSGGSVDVGIGGCTYGYVSSAPDVTFYYTTERDNDLYVYVEGEGDTTLLIHTLMSGRNQDEWVCDDDSYGEGDPIIVLRHAPRNFYAIWVGSYSNESHDATLYISEIDPRGNTPSGNVSPGNTSSGQVPDYSLEPAYGSETLEEGFLPDPHTVDLVAGGSIDLDVAGCTYGYVVDAPDFDLYYETSGGSDLYIYAMSDEDTTLLVNTPDGNWTCNDDGYSGNNPLIVLPAAAGGLYDIWVGSYGGDTAGATLYISERDPR